ncbi:MAG: 30S ribosomal protein S4, partial [Candidatus Gribaldobacteria bacterium]|nr:30S ribosomal protein S4 [Candidatus Gribaldobacteria bacterium]
MNQTCKICRRLGQKIMLKGEKCLSPKCTMVKRPFPPGPKKKRGGRGNVSEYGKQLAEKQKLQKYYGLRAKQFGSYVKKVLHRRGKVDDATMVLVRALESRLDNVVFRLGFAKSRSEARQLVSHMHFKVNGKPVNIPSFETKKGMVITVEENKREKTAFKNLSLTWKNFSPPSWLK